MLAKDIMTTNLTVLNENSSMRLGELVSSSSHVRHLPIVNDDQRLVGILSLRDLLLQYAEASSEQSILVKDHMTTELYSADTSTPTSELAKIMIEQNISCLPILDNESLVGIVTERDFVHLAIDN